MSQQFLFTIVFLSQSFFLSPGNLFPIAVERTIIIRMIVPGGLLTSWPENTWSAWIIRMRITFHQYLPFRTFSPVLPVGCLCTRTVIPAVTEFSRTFSVSIFLPVKIPFSSFSVVPFRSPFKPSGSVTVPHRSGRISFSLLCSISSTVFRPFGTKRTPIFIIISFHPK